MVKCAECGFLTMRHRRDRYLAEVEDEIRENGQMPIEVGENRYVYERVPVCFDGAYILSREYSSSEPDTKELLRVFQNDRECTHWIKWQQGFTPKEHREMIDRKWERKWHIITGILFVVLAGLFTLLGVYIANLN